MDGATGALLNETRVKEENRQYDGDSRYYYYVKTPLSIVFHCRLCN